MKRYIAGILTLVCGLALATETQKTIPKQFLGEWGADTKSCLHLPNDPDTDTLTMHVEPSRISFYERAARVLAVATNGERELALIVEMSGEGDTWLSTIEFELSTDKNSITEVTGHQKSPVRVRCVTAARK